MDSRLLAHLWKSPEVRNALKKEALKLLLFVIIYVGSVGAFRYFTDRPIREGLLSAAFGAFAIVLAQSVAVIRTIRAVLREHSLLG
jgi:uncharacterized membrane protein